MPKKNDVPTYLKHKSSGQAYVQIHSDGRRQTIYLGPYGSQASRSKYASIVSAAAGPPRRIADPADKPDLTVTELIAAYWIHACDYYVKADRATNELGCLKIALRPLRRAYGDLPAAEFGPRKLKALQIALIDLDYCRNFINACVNRIRRVFKWAVAAELIDETVHRALTAVDPLLEGRKIEGRTPRESLPVQPVADDHIDAVRPHISPTLWAMIQTQLLTAMRPGEARLMRGAQIDRSGPIWLYRPLTHKTQHLVGDKLIAIGPRAQQILTPLLIASGGWYIFSPRRAELQRLAELHAARRTPLSCGNRPGTNRRRRPRKVPGEFYTPGAYRAAIARACDRAFPPPADVAADAEKLTAWRLAHRWHPHQLRHTAATRIRGQFSLEQARAVLGHADAATTEIYAHAADLSAAMEVVRRIG